MESLGSQVDAGLLSDLQLEGIRTIGPPPSL